MKPYSLTRRLITMVLLIELASALCVSGVALIYERHMHFRSFDVLLRGRADSLLGAVQDSEDANDNVMLDGSERGLPADDIYEVRDAGGRLVGKSPNWQGSQTLKFVGRASKENLSSASHDENHEIYSDTVVSRLSYRVIRIGGLRVVDPGDQRGGVRRYVIVFYGSPVLRVWGAIYRAVAFYAASSLVVLAITGVLMSWLLNRSLASLRSLAYAAGNVTVASWSFSPPAEARDIEELKPLIHAMEALLAGLQLSFEKQERFVGDAAHELKTGVSLVKSSLQLLTMKPRTQAEYRAGLERCLLDCQRMEELVLQMLTLARVEESFAGPSTDREIELYELIQEVTSQLEPMARSKNIPIVVTGPDSLVPQSAKVRADAEQLKLLVSNLLINSLQHSSAESAIRVEIGTLRGFAQILIRDHGDGIDPVDLPTIFDRFSRSDRSRSRDTGGTGLGLSICKAVTDRYGGTIEVTSEMNRGTVAVVRLPLAPN